MRPLLPVLVLAVLAGCVTESETVFTEEPSPTAALQQHVELARRYIGEGNWEDAKRNLQSAVAIDDGNPEVYEAFALVYQSTGETELAEVSFERAIALDRDFSRARNNFAAFLYSQERYEEAEKQLERVVQDTLYNARPRAFVNLAICRLKLEDRAGAEEALERALRMEPRSAFALLELVELRLDAGDSTAASNYYGRYRKVVRQQSARGLWLGIRVARAAGDADAESSYALALRNLYPESTEYSEYRRTLQRAPVRESP